MDLLKSAFRSPKLKDLKRESSVHILEPKVSQSTSNAADGFKKTFQSRLRIVKPRIFPTKRRADRQTVVFLEGFSQKKNLAYYDKQIYNVLKLRKQIQVEFELVDHLESGLVAYRLYFRYHAMTVAVTIDICLINLF